MYSEPDMNFYHYDNTSGVGFHVGEYQKATTPQERECVTPGLVAAIGEYTGWAANSRSGMDLEFSMPVRELGQTLRRFIQGEIQLPPEAVLKIIEAAEAVDKSRHAYMREPYGVLKSAIALLDDRRAVLSLTPEIHAALNRSPCCLEAKREFERSVERDPRVARTRRKSRT
jgi:hypothetical protein